MNYYFTPTNHGGPGIRENSTDRKFGLLQDNSLLKEYFVLLGNILIRFLAES